MFNSTVCRLNLCFPLVSLILMQSYVLAGVRASTDSGEDVFDNKVWQKLKEDQSLEYQLITTSLDSHVYSIVRDESSFDTSFLIGTRKGVSRLSGESMTVTDQWNETIKSYLYWNRLVMVDYKTQPEPSIISCGSTENGICRLHNYSSLNIFQVIENPNDPVNSIASHYRSEVITSSVSSNTVFFIHHQYDRRPLTQSPPLLSARILEIPASGPPTFRYAKQEHGSNSSFDIHPNFKTNPTTTIKRIFVYKDFLYYAREHDITSTSPKSGTRLGKVSLNDLSFTYYQETELVCNHKDQHFSILKEAYFQSDNIGDSSQDSLVGVFMKVHANGRELDYGAGSVFCIFSMEAILKKFREDDSKCSSYSSFTWTNPKDVGNTFYKKSSLCNDDSEKDESNSKFCWIPVNNRILKCPLESKSVWESRTQINGFVTDQQGDDKILLYTEKNYITKVVLPSNKPPSVTFKQSLSYDTITSLVLSKELRGNKKTNDSFVYFGINNEVVKFPLTSCSIYRTCASCLASNDTLDCGWCGAHCVRRSECPNNVFNNETCSPMIYGFYPQKASLAGGTMLEIRGQNFGSISNGSISIAGVDCRRQNILYWDFNSIILTLPSSKLQVIGPISLSLLDKVPFKTFYSYVISMSYSKFEYTNPTFERMIPTTGQVLKGIEVHVIGNNFDLITEDSVKVQLISFHEEIDRLAHVVNTTHIRFETSYLPATAFNITIVFGKLRTKTGLIFHVVDNPVIDSVDTATALCSGQTSIIVKGNNFHQIQNITLGMDFSSDPENRTNCRVDTANQMTCFAPKCPFNLKSGKQRWTEINFHTDNFTIIYPESKAWQINYSPDPNFENLAKNTKVYIDDPVLQLSGSDLCFGSNILISVDNWTCNVLLVKQECNQLLCSIQFGDDIPVEGYIASVGYRLRENDETNNLGNIVLLSRPTPEAVPGIFEKQWYILIMTATFILLFPIAIAIAYRKLRQQNSQHKGYQDGHVEFPLSEYAQKNGVTNGYHKKHLDDAQTLFMSAPHESLKSEALDLLEKENKLIVKDRLILGDFIGEGHFGRVYKAQLWDINKEAKEKVAVKTLQTSVSSQSELNVFIKEALIMKDFCHPRVLNLIGVSFLNFMSPVVVTAFMAKGDLLTFLRNDDKNPKVSDLIAFATEIAEGMQYLANKKFVHRDLAARNCLLDHENHIKIADFGLSRDIYEKDYYRPEDKGLMPVKWMAPESLEDTKFTTKSDVWSFGVTFWEIITRGLPPYNGIPAWHVINFLKAGERLGKPEHCPASIYELMKLCWSWDPNDRPTFTDILQEIHLRVENIERKGTDNIIERKDVYVNVSDVPYYTHQMQIVWDDV